MMRRTLLMLFLLWPFVSMATIEAHKFDTPEQEQKYKTLTHELRCLVCQNQDIADSNAELAQDLRRQTYDQVMQGKSVDEVVDYMVARYGDFVRYKPAFKPLTWMLWVGPFLLLGAGILVVLRIVRRREGSEPSTDEPDAAALERARKLLEDER